MITDPLRRGTLVLALAGAAIAAYLSYTRLTANSILCPTSGCETVQRSAHSKLVGIPVAYLGFVTYVLLAAIALSARRWALRLTAVIVGAAAAFSVYLLVVQLAVIHAVCAWCVASDVVVLSLTGVVALREISGRRRPA